MPPRLNLSSEKLERHGLYLLEDGQNIYIWMGKEAVPPLCMDFLNIANINQVQSGQVNHNRKISIRIFSHLIKHLTQIFLFLLFAC